MDQAGAVPAPAPGPGEVRGGSDSAMGRPQTPGEGAETGGREAGVSTRGETRSAEAPAERGPPKQDVV